MWRPGDEPIPGYCLERFLGRGNFGEVWLARAPGGTSAALKFIDLSGKNGIREFRGVTRVKGIKHANLMPITAIWMLDENGELVDDRQLQEYDAGRETTDVATDTLAVSRKSQPQTGCLVVAMLAGDKNLGERLEECQDEGLAGIPVDELLGCMEEAAKGLDRLNLFEHDLGEGPKRIQHCDIKPANMMLVGGAVLVCDFGLAQVLGDTHVSQSITGSPAFMAPECFEKDGTSTNRDQYALAVAYHELRTGALPFDDESYAAVRDAHAKGTLNLSRLPAAEQAVIRRATSLKPGDRYPSSAEMVQTLKRAVHPSAAGSPKGKRFRTLGAAAMLGCLVITTTVAVWRLRPVSDSVELSFAPADAQVQIDGEARTIENGKLRLPLDDTTTLGIRVSHRSGEYQSLDRSYTKAELQHLGFTIQLPRLVSIRFQPEDVRVQIDGTEQALQQGALVMPLDDRQSIRIHAAHDSGWYEPIDRDVTKDELERQDFRLELRRFEELQFHPANVIVRVDDVGRALVDGKLRLLLDDGTPIRIAASDPSGMFQGLDQIYAKEDLRKRKFQITLEPSAKNYAATAFRLYDESSLDKAREQFRAAAKLGYDTSILRLDIAKQTTGAVRLAEISPGGRWLVTASKNTDAVHLLDLTGADPAAATQVLSAHEDLVNCAAFSQDDRHLITGGRDKAVRRWDLASPTVADQASVLGRQNSDIVSIAMDRSNRRIASADFAGTIQVWGLNDPAASDPAATIPSESEIREIQFDPTGQWLIGLSELGELFRWDMRTDEPVSSQQSLPTPDCEVKCVTWTPDGRRLFAGASGGSVFVWDMTGDQIEPAEVRTAHGDDIESVTVSANGKYLVTGSSDREVRVWELADQLQDEPRILLGHDHLVSALSIGSGSRWLVTGSWDKTIRVWDLRSSNPAASCIVLADLADRVRSLAIDPNRRWLVACGIGGNAMLWDFRGLLLDGRTSP